MATGVLAYAYSPQMGTETMNYMTAETRLGEDNLTPGFITHLEKFYKKANAKDRAKCLELLTALNIQEDLNTKLQPCRSLQPSRCKTPGPNWKPLSGAPTPEIISDTPRVKFVPAPPLRPKTAMALAGRRINKDPYQTTYSREFVGMTGQAATEDRPSTSKGIIPSSYKLSGATTYSTEFAKKPVIKAEQTRAGSSSGNRRNNPHPKEAFMVWRFGQDQLPERPDSKWATGLTDEIMDKVVRGKCRSTYQNDYIGSRQGQKMESSSLLSDMSEDLRQNVPFSLDSSMRQAYQVPRQQPIFKGNTSRFGCNRRVAATGTVPDTSTSQMHIKTRTTYEREFSDNVPANATDLRDIGRRLGAETLQKYMDTTNDNEKETLTAMLKAPNDSRCGSRSSSRHARVIPEATQIYSYKPEDFKPQWLSSWTGPM
ncbi:testis-expressed protein 26-like [Lineus longissimus]|uniref:testis-expressed protein 26-like n=1 Tax=Lineus longissimus TaxID=88925 RepID=UPI002B4CEA1F